MTRPDTIARIRQRGQHPLICNEQKTLSGNEILLATMDVQAIYLKCPLCHQLHAFSRKVLMLAWEELDRQKQEKSTV